MAEKFDDAKKAKTAARRKGFEEKYAPGVSMSCIASPDEVLDTQG